MQFPMHDDFLEEVTRSDGGRFPITVQRVSDRESPALDFSTPRLVMRVRPSSLLRVGDVITRVGRRYMLGAHSETSDYRSFWAFEAQRQVTWKTVVKTTDPLTGLERSSTLSAGTNLWVAWELMTRQPYERQIGVSNEQSRVLTTANVQLNDVIDGQQVKRINYALGLTIAEVQ